MQINHIRSSTDCYDPVLFVKLHHHHHLLVDVGIPHRTCVVFVVASVESHLHLAWYESTALIGLSNHLIYQHLDCQCMLPILNLYSRFWELMLHLLLKNGNYFVFVLQIAQPLVMAHYPVKCLIFDSPYDVIDIHVSEATWQQWRSTTRDRFSSPRWGSHSRTVSAMPLLLDQYSGNIVPKHCHNIGYFSCWKCQWIWFLFSKLWFVLITKTELNSIIILLMCL